MIFEKIDNFIYDKIIYANDLITEKAQSLFNKNENEVILTIGAQHSLE